MSGVPIDSRRSLEDGETWEAGRDAFGSTHNPVGEPQYEIETGNEYNSCVMTPNKGGSLFPIIFSVASGPIPRALAGDAIG